MTATLLIIEHVRLLHARSEYGYTDSLRDAVPDEPEAVSADCQQQLTHQAQMVEADRTREAWGPHRDGFRQHLQQLQHERLAIDLSSDLRALSRLVERIDGRIRQL